MSCAADLIIVNAGSSITLPVDWEESAGVPTDLTGWTADTVDAATELSGRLTVVIINAALGQTTIRLNGATPSILAPGDYAFRARVTPSGGDPITTNILIFRVQ